MKKLIVLLSALALSAPLLADEARVRSPSPAVVGAVSHVLLPTSAFASGKFGAVFKTRISIANVTSSAYDIRVGFSTGAGEAVVRSLAILPYETRTFDNFLSDVLQTSGAGSIDFDSQNAAYRFIVAGQVYVDGPNGRFSTAVQAGDEDGTIIAGRPGYVVGISVDAYDRTNLGCASDSPFAQTITARVYSAANVLLGTLSFDMNPWGWRQVGVDVGVTDGTMVISSTQRAVCFGVVVDNVSNDGTYQIAVPD